MAQGAGSIHERRYVLWMPRGSLDEEVNGRVETIGDPEGAGLLKLREARTLEVTMFPEGRAEKVLSCRLPDMHQTFAAIEKEAASSRPR